MSQQASRRSTPENGLKENWFHGTVGREDAERILKDGGLTEGLFLVRESKSSQGDFVLSVVHNREIIHYQIRRRDGEDALFSLSAEEKVIHGLDEMIHFYQHEKKSGLQHRLIDFVPGGIAPPETRLHGTENLLHRASTKGNFIVVSELLASGYRNLTAKNHDSQTAVHLASFYGHRDILEQLLKYGAKVNISDTEGYTPLHYACQVDKPYSVKALLEKGGANPTIRNELTQWVPLHEAAWKGHLECVSVLLEFHAPTKPRTPKNETPADLARAAGHQEVAVFLDSFPVAFPETDIIEWYHPNVDRKHALVLLNEARGGNGTYLIRNSSKKIRFFVLSMIWKGKGHHFEIEKQGIFFFIDEGPYMMSLEHLVQHYSRFSDGLPCQLLHPVKPREVSASLDVSTTSWDFLHSRSSSMSTSTPSSSPKPPARVNSKLIPPSIPTKSKLAEFHGNQICNEVATLRMDDKVKKKKPDKDDNPTVPPRVPFRGFPTSLPSNLKPVDKRKLYENNETLRRVRHSKDNIPLESIKLTLIIGEGEFGSVYKGSYMTEAGIVKDVAIKALSNETIEPGQSDEFLSEAKVMMDLDHQCVVQLLGISHGPPVLMVLELVPLGSMLSYLEEQPDSVSTDMEIPLWASQIACGMLYLQSKKFVHRDLAARNILLSSKYQTKISDFGLSRVVGDKEYYRASKGGRWPVKWYAPECINYGTFSHASDVWSYGIVLWEMYSYGKQPYKDKTGAQTVEYIESGHRLPMPEMATDDVYDIMLKCWAYKATDRLQFEELFKIFADNPEYMNLTELLKIQDLQQLGM
eukprot:GFUD01030624.1.p1 GENE.GFUD01030624.1~~GFUD01030624.1.p1  ORF type:complete len:807 (+),score=129.29 GFUD01030624.1:58-2478(+)